MRARPVRFHQACEETDGPHDDKLSEAPTGAEECQICGGMPPPSLYVCAPRPLSGLTVHRGVRRRERQCRRKPPPRSQSNSPAGALSHTGRRQKSLRTCKRTPRSPDLLGIPPSQRVLPQLKRRSPRKSLAPAQLSMP